MKSLLFETRFLMRQLFFLVISTCYVHGVIGQQRISMVGQQTQAACATYTIKPSPANTGIADPGVLTAYDGPRTIDVDGTVIENKMIYGNLKIDGATNVVVRNSIIHGEGAFYALDITGGAQEVLIEDVEITDAQSAIVYIHDGSGATLRRVHLHESAGDAMKTTGAQGVLVESSYFAPTIGSGEGAHADGNQTRAGGNDVTFIGNTIDMPIPEKGGPGAPYKSNANFIIQADAGNISNFHIECNWLDGGNYTVYFIQDKNDLGYVNSNPKLVHNTFGRGYRYGVLNVGSDVQNPVICGNTWEDTGELMEMNTSTDCAGDGVEPGQVSTPQIAPDGGSWLEPVEVTLTTTTDGATIYFTVDGTTPTSTSTLYSGPFTVSSTTMVQAIAVKSDMADSPVYSATFTFGSFEAGSNWRNVAFTPQSERFTLSFDISPSASPIDGVTGIGAGPSSGYTDLAAIIRFNPSGQIDARNGGIYDAAEVLDYSAGQVYHVQVDVDVMDKAYSATVTPAGGNPVLIANAYGFRSEQQSVEQLQYLGMYSTGGTHTVSSLELKEGGAVTHTERLPGQLSTLHESYPNPFRTATSIPYVIAEPGHVRIHIYNQLGQLVRVLVDAHQRSGAHSVKWDGRDGQNRSLASGIYLYQMDINGSMWQKPVVLLR